ncbi:N-acetylmuramoyl-L-alanine amidase [Candidatus Bipolaricaulota bacterium]
MTKRGIVAIGAVVVIAVAVVLVLTLDRPDPVEPPPTYKIALDAGHGGRDPGANPDGVLEKDINLTIAKLLLDLAEAEENLDPVLIRSLDIFISLEDRIVQAEAAGAVLYVTIHANSYSSPDPHGVETIVDNTREIDDESWVLAELIQDGVVNATGANDRGTRTQESYLQRTAMPAVSVETGYVTNPEERAKLVDPEYQAKVAEGILAGIRQFVDWKYPESVPATQPAGS